MAIKLKCPACKASFTVPEAARGKKGRCPKCHAVLDASHLQELPAEFLRPGPAASGSTLDFTDPRPSRRAARAERDPTRMILIVLGILALIAVIGTGVIIANWNTGRYENGPFEVVATIEPGPRNEPRPAPEPVNPVVVKPAPRPEPRPQPVVPVIPRPEPVPEPKPPAPPKPEPPPPPKPEQPAGLGKLADLVPGRWSQDGEYRLHFFPDGKGEQANFFGKLGPMNYEIVDEVTVALSPAGQPANSQPRSYRILFRSRDEFSLAEGRPPFANEKLYRRMGPSTFGGFEQRRVIPTDGVFPTGLQVSSDGKRVAAVLGKTIKVYDLATGEDRAVLIGHQGGIRAVAFLPGNRLISGAHDHTVRLWNLATSKQLASMGGQGALNSLAVDREGRLLASGGFNDMVKLHDLRASRDIAELRLEGNATVNAVAISPDGRLLAGGGQTQFVKLWELPKAIEKTELRIDEERLFALAFAPDSKSLATAGAQVRLWDVATGGRQATFKVFRNQVRGLAFAPDGKTLAVACGKWVQLYDPAEDREVGLIISAQPEIFSLAWGSDSKTLLLGSADGIGVWEKVDGDRLPPGDR